MRGIQTYDYDVTGTGEFPFDMLRYDQAWPRNEANAAAMDRPIRPSVDFLKEKRTIQLRGLREPTILRWESFGWEVTDFQRSFVLEANATVR